MNGDVDNDNYFIDRFHDDHDIRSNNTSAASFSLFYFFPSIFIPILFQFTINLNTVDNNYYDNNIDIYMILPFTQLKKYWEEDQYKEIGKCQSEANQGVINLLYHLAWLIELNFISFTVHQMAQV